MARFREKIACVTKYRRWQESFVVASAGTSKNLRVFREKRAIPFSARDQNETSPLPRNNDRPLPHRIIIIIPLSKP